MKARALAFIGFTILIALMALGNAKAAAGTHPGISNACATGSLSISSSGLLRSYDMETIVSSKAKDFSSAADHATAVGGVTIGGITGKFGKSTDFDGSNDALTGTNPGTPAAYTFALYLYPRTTGAKIALALGGPGGSGNTYVSYGIIAANKFTAADGTSLTTSAATYAVNTWHSIVVTDSGSTLTLRVDGTASTTTDVDGTSAWTGLNIGMFNSNLFYDGYIDEVSIWNRVLSSDEILTYEAGPNGVCAIPPSILTVTQTSIVCNGATLNGNLTSKGTAAIIAVGFQYGKSPTLAGATNITVSANASVGAFNKTVSGLDANTFYYFRAWANGTDGYAQGAILYFQTSACPPVTTCTPDQSGSNLLTLLMLSIVAGIVFLFGIRFNAGMLLLSGILTLSVGFAAFSATCNLIIGIAIELLGLMIILWTIGGIIDARKEGQT